MRAVKSFFVVFVSTLMLFGGSSVTKAAPVLSVQDAMNESNGTDVTLEGYIVGVPTAVDYVQQSDFTSNYALALADDPDETSVSNMILVKLDSEYRSEFGLQNHPEHMGDYLRVSGTRDDYFSHEGVEYVTSIETASDGSGSGNDGDTGGSGGTYDGSYYDSVEGMTGQTLKNSLNDLIDQHAELTYDEVWDALRHTDEDPANTSNVVLLYSGRSQSKYTNGGGVDEWNREHVWAKSHGDFGTAMGPGTDLHHLRPTDVTVNSSRGNLDFDDGGSAVSEAPGTYSDSDSWEPRDEVKGDVARMIFYMAVRYEGEHSGEPDLEISDYVNTSGAHLGRLSTLLEWNEEDPVSDFERNRNNIIYDDYQGNRNPFVDHPEYADMIW
ncbi:endonuclease [Halobacillus salinarum]|uniref:Endonuclease n=1 Tax=Halobacillus salinarum TaxID=2932257 RepID=A0ABY4EIH1_9BACI|nr:endonuclease [Halobacillus salinarum]UOQ43891.1 endonuclease [Halobacillus salinarum]